MNMEEGFTAAVAVCRSYFSLSFHAYLSLDFCGKGGGMSLNVHCSIIFLVLVLIARLKIG